GPGAGAAGVRDPRWRRARLHRRGSGLTPGREPRCALSACWCIRVSTANTIMGGLDIVFDNTRGVASHERARGHVPCDNARRRNDAIIPYSHPRQDYGMGTNEAITANMHVSITVVDIVVSQDRGAECDSCVRSDVDAPRIGLVKLGAQGNAGAFPDIHLPNSNEVLAAERHHDGTQLLTYPRR